MGSTHRTSRPPSLRRLLGLALLQTLLFTIVPAVAWGATTVVSDRFLLPSADEPGTPHSVLAPAAKPDAAGRRLSGLMRRWGCTTGGLGDGVIPAHTLVRTAGRVRVASFDVGWAASTGEARGELVAVCRR